MNQIFGVHSVELLTYLLLFCAAVRTNAQCASTPCDPNPEAREDGCDEDREIVCEQKGYCYGVPNGCDPGQCLHGLYCYDINECEDAGVTGCDDDPEATCVNTVGGFTCTCPENYEGDGIGSEGCTDIDECKDASDDCDEEPEAACVNTDPGYMCTCPEFYKGDGMGSDGCTDIDECADTTADCDDDPSATCKNTDGGYMCTCPENYKGDGKGSDGCEGSWSPWGYGTCDPCGQDGMMDGTRTCMAGIGNCDGDTTETVSCGTSCAWGEWSNWDACEMACGTRKRTCLGDEADDCWPGGETDTDECGDGDCTWTEWADGSSWSGCDCGGPDRTENRARYCPIEDKCGGSGPLDYRQCDDGDANWCTYGSWTCDGIACCEETCGEETGYKEKTCNGPGSCHPTNGKDSIMEEVSCSHLPDCVWESWNGYGSCNKLCDGGTQTRTRSCERSNQCSIGSASESQPCNQHVCECNSNPCQNGGTCHQSLMEYTCECPYPFYGDHCQFKCTCVNGGSCRLLENEYICDCPIHYEGDQCELDRRPACVTNFTGNPISHSEVYLSWDQSRDECFAEEYQIHYELINRDQCYAPIPDSGYLPYISGNEVILNLLIPYSKYKITVVPRRVVNTPGLETWVELGMNLTIEKDTLSHIPTAPPTNVQVNTTDRAIMLTWDLVPCGYRMGAHNTYFFEFEPYTDEEPVLAARTPRTGFNKPYGVKCDTTYTFRVAAVTNTGRGPYTDPLSFTTDLNSDPFKPDSILQVLPNSPTSVNVNWRPNNCPASAFTVEYRLINQDQCLYDELRSKVLVTATTERGDVSVDNLMPFSSYEFCVSAKNSQGETVTKVATFTTFAEIPTGTPQYLQLVSATRDALALTWNPVACGERRGNIQAYVYELIDNNGDVVRTNVTSLTTLTLFHLDENKEYSFRVAARNSAGQGSFTTALAVSTTLPNYDCDDNINPCDFGFYPIFGICEVVRIIIVDVAFIRIDDLPAVFTLKLADTSSPEYNVLSCRIELQMEIIFLDYGLLDAEVLTLYDSSVGSQVLLRFHLASDRILNEMEAVNRINEVAGAAGDIGDRLVLKTPISAEDICPLTYCSNGGTCVSQGPFYPGICQCPDPFEGPRCEIAGESDNSALFIGFSVGGGVLFLLLLAACLLAFCVFQRRRWDPKIPAGQQPYLVDPNTQAPPWSFGPVAQSSYF